MESIHERVRNFESPYKEELWSGASLRFSKFMPSGLSRSLKENIMLQITQPFLWDFDHEPLLNYSFGTCQHRKIFPHFHPPNLLGNKFPPIRGAPNRGPGCYIAEDKYGFAYNLSKIPTSKKGYTLGARTALRFKPVSKDVTPYPGMYQTVNDREQTHKPNFAPFNALLPRFRTYSKDAYYPGPTTYNPEIKPPKRVRWPMKFGSPDWAQVPCLQKRTLRAEYAVMVFIFLAYFTLYNGLQFHPSH
ncbi:hypothetical protein FD754_004034 [Muntiacus muntjak]|uniref:Protein pitchfork n=1 Tax=Muntiacus muntjak TaxID=9888 RepID=A0A5N3WGG0_MUNMU|nr:hypothetical protein FD754_004034 [Muntiacus muntjak]